jgi:ABC-type sugar transport system ATPase subunit
MRPGAAAVGVRPEALRISREGPEARVALVEALGAETLVHLRLGEDRMILRDGHGTPLREGHMLRLAAEPEAVMFFDAEGRAMERGSQPALRVVD